MKNARAVKPFGLRLPEDLREWIKVEAERERRSLNGQVIAELDARRRAKSQAESLLV